MFYSRIKNFRISTGKGQRVIENGESKLLEDPEIQFSPMGSDSWGMFVTSDPGLIAFLDKRIKDAGVQTDIFTAEQYREQIVPADSKLKLALSENQKLKDQNNRLLAMLEQQKVQQAPVAAPLVDLATSEPQMAAQTTVRTPVRGK
jgi:hypothetical protein